MDEEKPDFKIYFNKKKQWVNVFLWDVHPNTFANWDSGRWAYFIAKWENHRKGLFGELHFVKSRIREDVVAHECLHAVAEWFWSGGNTLTRLNEERFCETLDELVRKFYREYSKLI